MGIYNRAMRRMSKTTAMRWVLSMVLTPLDMKLKGSRFAPSTLGMDVPLCYLTTIGRRSGEPQTVPLLYVETDDGVPAVAATNFGRDRRPAWALNLEASPQATLEVDGEMTEVSATHAAPDETAVLWPRFDDIWPAYEKYREIAHRDVKVFLLNPVS